MPTNHVLRVPLGDSGNENRYVIVCAIAEGDGNQSIVLEGTEGEVPYFSKFNASKLASARDTKSPLQPAEWMATLLHTLLPTLHPAPPPSSPKTTSSSLSRPSTASTPSISVTASILNSTLHLRLLHAYPGGLTQRLGSLSIPAAEEHEIDFMKWTSAAVLYAEYEAKQRIEVEQSRKAYEAAAQKLEAQMQELISAKDEGERKLLASCCELLNMKKAKVRGLMRAMEVGNEVKIKKEIKQEVSSANEEGDLGNSRSRTKVSSRVKTRQVGTSRKGKRKQDTGEGSESLSNEIPESEESDSGFEDMGGRMTPDRSENDITEDEGENPPPQPPKQKLGVLGGSKSRSQSRRATQTREMSTRQARSATSNSPDQPAARASRAKQDEVEDNSPPPRRKLPFGGQKPATKEKSPEDDIDDDRMEDTGPDMGARRVTEGTNDDDPATSDDEL